MAVADYDTLKSAIQSYCARSDSKFAARIPDFVGFCEDRLYNGGGSGENDATYTPALRSSVLEYNGQSITLTAGEGTIPADCLELRKLYVDGAYWGVEYLPPERFYVEAQNDYGTQPRYYTIEGTLLSVTPTADGALFIDYYRQLPAITESNKTGNMLAAHGLIYLELCLFEAFSWMQETELAVAHLAKGRGMILGANRTSDRLRFAGKLRSRSRVNIP